MYQYYRLRLQFLVLLMMGAVTPETCRVTAVNKYLHAVASGWIFINILKLIECPPPPPNIVVSMR